MTCEWQSHGYRCDKAAEEIAGNRRYCTDHALTVECNLRWLSRVMRAGLRFRGGKWVKR